MAAVVRLVTFVDLVAAGARQMSVSACHEAELADGSRVVLLDDRGWTSSQGWAYTASEDASPEHVDFPDIWADTSVEDIRATARAVVGPDEPPDDLSHEEVEADHWASLQEVLQQRGVTVDAAELGRLPHEVVLSQRLRARIGGDPDVGAAGRVDPSNVDQLRGWDGDEGEYWAQRADRFDEGIAGYHDRFLDAAAIDASAEVLDIGCGSGRTTRDAARRASDGRVLGVDLSSRMLELARRRAEREHLANATFEQADAQVHPFPEEHFDVAISRNGAMFFGDPPTAFANIARALRPGGRLVLLAWQPFERNEHIRAFRTALAAGRDLPPPPPDEPGPFALSEPDRVRELLTSAGFAQVGLESLSEPMYFGRDVDDACEFIAGQLAGMLDGLDADDRARALDDLRASMAEHRTDRGVYYDSAAWLIRATRS